MSGIVVLADVPLGYGSPQIVRLASTLARLLNTPATIIAPKGDAAATAVARANGVALHEIGALASIGDHRFDIEFNLQAAREADKLKPEWLVVCGFLGAPALLSMKTRARRCIYFGYEHTNGSMPWVTRTFAGLGGRFDLAIFPEEHRAALDAPRLHLQDVPTLVIYNGVVPLTAPAPAGARTGRIVYGGLIDPKRTFGADLLGGAFDDLPIDIYGRMEGFADPDATIDALNKRSSSVRYHGQLAANGAYHKSVGASSAALVAWSPSTEATLFACPNKFFDAIAMGVPPVSTPHPQTARLIRQFSCGWITAGFEASDVRRAMEVACSTFGTREHADLIDNCINAAQPVVGWGAQARKIEQALADL